MEEKEESAGGEKDSGDWRPFLAGIFLAIIALEVVVKIPSGIAIPTGAIRLFSGILFIILLIFSATVFADFFKKRSISEEGGFDWKWN